VSAPTRTGGLRVPAWPGAGLVTRAAALTLAAWGAVAAAAWAVSGAEGRPLPAVALLVLLGPLAWAVGVSLAVEGAVRRGDWAGWLALGHGPARLGAGLLAAGLLAGGLSLAAGGAAASVPGWALPSPVDPAARVWPAGDGWSTPDLRRWTAPPSSLTFAELLDRSAAPGPTGSRVGVDRAELLRRAGTALAWPLGAGVGLLAGRRSRRRDRGPGTAAGAAGAAVAFWLLAIALLVAGTAGRLA
jgi:hypothetical protein